MQAARTPRSPCNGGMMARHIQPVIRWYDLSLSPWASGVRRTVHTPSKRESPEPWMGSQTHTLRPPRPVNRPHAGEVCCACGGGFQACEGYAVFQSCNTNPRCKWMFIKKSSKAYADGKRSFCKARPLPSS